MKLLNQTNTYLSRFGNRSHVLITCFAFNLFIYLVMFVRAFQGSALRDWGYSEFLLNYSSGFIRRGLTGTLLEKVYIIFNINPYIFLTTFLSIVLICNLIGFYFLLFTSKINSISILILSSSPLLLNAPFLSVVMFRKDWLIVLGITAHAVFARLVLLDKITAKTYLIFFMFLILYSEFVILSHEINLLFLTAHFFLIKNVIHCFTNLQRKAIKKLFIFFSFLQFSTFTVLSFFHGTPKQVERIAQNIPDNFNLGNINAILSIGNLPTQQFNSITKPMFLNAFIVVFFLIWFLIGPTLIYFLLRSKDVWPSIRFCVAIMPLFTLFVLGNDWGRWIILISFVVFLLLISDWRMCLEPFGSRNYERKVGLAKPKLRLLLIISLVFTIFLLVRIPIYTPSSILDFFSGISEILASFLP
jgi:hypothetical protein